MSEKEPTKRHPLKGPQDSKLEVRDDAFTREQIRQARGLPETFKTGHIRREEQMEEDIEAIREVIRKHHKTPLQNPRE